jgi:DNA invertase Pin-like site-specific DNA recombinase
VDRHVAANSGGCISAAGAGQRHNAFESEGAMKAAIYARKSTDDSDRDAENKSVTRQIEHAKAYAIKQGWNVEGDHVYVDDGISGAEFKNRPGLLRMLNALKQFDVVVMSELSRIGRDQIQTAQCLAQIEAAGIRVFFYLTGEELKFSTAVDRFLVNAVSFAAELEREKASQRSRDALARKANHGFNTGGVVYGYDNVQVYSNGDGQRKSHTDYRINEQQADVLRRIFRMYAAGHGHVTVAKTLNGDPRYAGLSKRYFNGARPPSPRKGTGSWAPSSVRAMLHNDRYTGIVPFGEFQKTYRQGTKKRLRRAANDILRTPRPDLRIIPDELWRGVQSRLEATRKTYIRDTKGKLWGRPGNGVESHYLLTGFGECGCCRRNITKLGGRVGSPGKRSVRHYYGCSYHANRGRTICDNGYLAPMEEADALVIGRMREVLTPDAVDFTIDAAVNMLANQRRDNADAPERLAAEQRKLRKELDRFVRLIGEGKAPERVLDEIKRRETRIAEIDHELQDFAIEEPSEFELRRLRTTFRERLGRYDELLRADVPVARQALRKLLAGRIEFLPDRAQGAYHLRWALVTRALVDGNIGVASPRGFEPRLPP